MQRFIDYFLIIGIDEEKQKRAVIDGKILCKLPEQDWEESKFIDENLALFCQPLGWNLTEKPVEPTFFISVLTDIKADRHYCACLSFSEPISTKSIRNCDDEETEYGQIFYQNQNTMYAPKCLVLVSRFHYIEILKNCLSIIFTVYIEEKDVSLETVIGNLLACVEVPAPGEPELEFSLGASDLQYLQSPIDPFVPNTGNIVYQLFEQLGIHTVLTLFIAVMTEHKVLIHSQSFSRLHDACEALISLMYPFKYSHVYIPLLPCSLTEVLNIPTPFLIGCHSKLKSEFEETLIETIIVDLDCGRLSLPDVKLPALDRITYNELVKQLCLIIKPQSVYADNAFQSIKFNNSSPPHLLDKEIRAVFLRFIAQVLQGYRNFLQVVRIFPKPFLTFHKTLFLGTRNLVENEFTIKLLDSMFFNTFIQERGLPYRCVDLFDNLFASINDILKEEEKNPNLFFKNIRNLAEKLLLNEFTCNTNNPVVKILTPSKEAIEKTCSKTFPKLDAKSILEKIENETIKKEMTQSLEEKKQTEKKIVPFGAKLSSISCTYSSNIMTNSAKRLEVMKNCINCIFENKITDARKTFPAVLRALKNKFARLALAEELSLYITNNKAVLEHEQFDLVVKLMNSALQQDCDYLSENASGLCTSELGDINGLSAAILPLSMTFCRRLNTGVIQFAYCCLQNHSVWSKMSFWESAFYSDAEKDLLALYGLDKNLSKEENYHQLVLNIAAEQMKLAETLTDEEIEERANKEESTVYSQAIHYSYRMVYLKIPLDICNIEKNSRSKHLNSVTDGHSDSNSNLTGTVTGRDSIFDREGRDLDNESGYEEVPTSKYAFCSNSEKSLNVIKYIDRFVDKVALEAGISEDHIKSLHNLIPSIVDLQCETLDGVFKESKKLPPPLKSKLITPYLLPGEKIVTNGLRAFLIEECRDEIIDFNNSDNANIDSIGDSMVNSIHLPAEGGIFLTNYRIIFRGKSYDPLSSETCIVKYFPISTLFKEKRISFPSHTFASFDQYLHEGLQLRSNIFQIINLAFDEEVNSDEIDHFCKAINKTTNPSSIFLWFAFTSQSPSYNQIDLLSLQNKKNKRGTFKGFAKKTLLKTAEKTGINVNRNKKRKEKYFMAPLSGSKTMLHSKTPIIMENINDDRSLNDDISVKSDSSHLFNNASNNSPNDPIMKMPTIHKEKDYRTLRKLVELPYVRDYQRLQIGNAKSLLISQSNSNNSSIISPSKQQHSKDFRISIVNLNYNVSQTYPAFIVVPTVIKDESIKKLSKCYKSQRFPAIVWKHPKNKTLLIRASSFHGKGVIGLFKSHGPSSNITNNLSNMSSSSQNDSTAFEQEKFFKTIVSLIPKKSENNTSYSASVNSLDLSMISDLNISNKELKYNKNMGMSSISRAFNTLRTSGGKSGLGTISHSMGKQIQKWNNKFNQDPDTNSLSSTVTSISQNSNLVKTNYAMNGGDSISSSTLGIVSLGLPKSISFYIFGEKIQIKNLKVDQFPSSCGFVPVEIHETKNVKHSFEKLLKVCCPSTKSKSKFKHGFYHEIENTDWLKQLQTILTISNDIVNTLNYKGCSAMLCLEESTDLVPQIISIVELCLDPYYRTFYGFKVLIEKEWLAFGHRFSHRSNQVTPIFLQFLDLVHQIMNQFPLSFEFNQYYLKFIAYHYMSCRFRTFMLDSEAERAEFGWIYEDVKKFDDDCDFISGIDFINSKMQDQDNLNNQQKNSPLYPNSGINYIGTSFWDYAESIWNKKSIFFNFYYVAASYLGESSDEKNLCVLKPKISLNNFRVWDYFLNEELNHGPSYDFEMIAFEKQRREEQEATEADNKINHGNKRTVVSPSMESVSHFQPNGIEEMLNIIASLENELNISEKNWYQMWDKIEIPMLSLTRLNSRNSNKKSVISYQILRRYNVSSNSINNFLLSNQKLHRFEKLNFATLIVCDYCKTIILDLARTGFKCKDCNLNCHERCYDYVSRTKCLGKELRSYINHSMDQEEENSENAEENKIDENTLNRSDTYFKQFSDSNSLAENQTYAGSLCKKGVLLKNWKRSWFVLDSIKHQLRYYESKENPSNKGFIDLADVVSVGVLSGAENNVFELKTIRRNYNFMAPDKHSASEWVEKIQACLQ